MDDRPETYWEWAVVRDRALMAEDRLRIIREALGPRHAAIRLGCLPWRWLRSLRAVRAALADDIDGGEW